MGCWILSGTAYNLAGDLSMCLTEDVVLSSEYRLMDHELNLCLHGHTITLEEKGRLTANSGTGTLNITDCKNSGKILGAKGCRGGLLYTYKGTINLYGGTVDGTNAEVGNIGSICVGYEGDSFTMYAGTLIGSRNAVNGGAVYVSAVGSAAIYGGTLTGGKVSGNGGVVCVNRGTLTLSGGTVTGGEAAGNGGGIYLGYNAETFVLSGGASVYGNTGSDIFLGSKASNVVTLANWNGDGYAKPNVYRDSAKANAAVMSSNVELDVSLLEQFDCVNSGYKLSLTSDKKSIVLTAN